VLSHAIMFCPFMPDQDKSGDALRHWTPESILREFTLKSEVRGGIEA
jgi:hypothetical protein